MVCKRLSEEYVNAVTHGVGFILALSGTVYVMSTTTPVENLRHLQGAMIFCITLVLTYFTSTMYHMTDYPTKG